MIFATALVLQRLLTFNRTFEENVVINATLGIAVAAFSILHCRINDLNVHSAVFGSMILYIGYRVRALTKEIKDPRHQGDLNNLVWSGSGNSLHSHLVVYAVMLTSISIVYAGAGFALWALDSLACSRLRQTRRLIGLPWGFFLEFHGWYVAGTGTHHYTYKGIRWHILTALGAHVFINLVDVILLDIESQTKNR